MRKWTSRAAYSSSASARPLMTRTGRSGANCAEAGDKLRAVHAGHDVVGDDEVDGVGIIVVAKLFEGALGAENGEDEVAGSLEDGLTGGGLDGVVVDEKQGMWHVVPKALVSGYDGASIVFSLCR